MIGGSVGNDQHNSVVGQQIECASNDQNIKLFKNQLGNNFQHLNSNEVFSDDSEGELRSMMNIQGALWGKGHIDRMILQEYIRKLQNELVFCKTISDKNVEAAYDELEALSFTIAHDLRSPLYAIKNNCEWLVSQQADNLGIDGLTILQQIAASSELMEKLLDGLLAFSKTVSLNPQLSSIDMTALAHSVINELLRCESGSSSLVTIVKPLMPAYCDAILMRQVWHNLLSNAFKYTRHRLNRTIEIDSHQSSGESIYCVSDNGVGFDMQYVDRLFSPFYRLHSAEEFEGTGVGLAIVQRIIRRHGGRVWAEGIVDNGSRFYFSLPNTQ